MAGGGIGPVGVAKERAQQYKGRVTLFVVMACVTAAIGGSIFGYDIGISGMNRIINWPFSQTLCVHSSTHFVIWMQIDEQKKGKRRNFLRNFLY